MAAVRNLQSVNPILQFTRQKYTNSDKPVKTLQCLASFSQFIKLGNKSTDKSKTCPLDRRHVKVTYSRRQFHSSIANRAAKKSLNGVNKVQSGNTLLNKKDKQTGDVPVGSVSSSSSNPQVLPQVDTPVEGFLCSNGDKMFKGLETEFPCITRLKDTGPEPAYHKVTKGFHLLKHDQPFNLTLNNGRLPNLDIAYETWGELNADKSNAVIVLAGLSASSHARSSVANPAPGWWEKFVGPGCAVDTNKFFVICPNNLGGCYGTSGPSTVNVLTGKPYATTFPIIGVEDMVNAIFVLLDHLGIDKLYGSVGSSLGGMLSLQSSVSYPDRVGRLITISSCAQSHPSSIAMRYLQRKCIMSDPNWNNGHYYEGKYPKIGMKLAREIATITYRSGPEWGIRFGRERISNDPPSLCPTFLIESYLEHQGESFSTKYDPNSLLYMSKAMDMYDVGEKFGSMEAGLAKVKCPVMVVGVQTDVLFPIWQQRELANKLQAAGNQAVTFYELNSLYGHDTFLLDLNGVGAAVKGFLETELRESGWLTKHNLQQDDRKHF